MNAAADQLLRRQHGASTVHQLMMEAGLTRGQVMAGVRRKRYSQPARGVVVAPGVPETPEFEAMLAVLRAGDGARLIGPRALGLLGIRGFRRTDPFGVLVPGTRRLPTNVDFLTFRDPVHRDGTLRADGIPVPRPARVVVEVARFLDGVALRSAVDAARWARRPTGPALVEEAFALPQNYVPAARIRALIRAGHLGQESEPERHLAAIVGDAFGSLESQVWVSSTRRVDLLLRAHNVVLEYQGADHRTEAGRRGDQVRDRELLDLGYRVVPVVHEDLAHPQALRARIRAVVNDVARAPAT